MRVGLDVHTLGRRQTGNETYMRELVTALAAIGDSDVEFVCYHTTPAIPVVHTLGRTRRLWPHSPLVRVPVSFPLALVRDRVDVAHFQYVSPPVTTSRVVLMVHDLSFESQPEFLPRLQVERMRWLVPASVRRATRILTVSRFTHRQLVERYRVHPDRVTVTPEAASPAFTRLVDRVGLRARVTGLGIPDRFILAVGNLQPRKNLRTLLDAYAALMRRGRIDQQLVLVGQVHYRGHEVLAHIDRLGIGRHVTWTGYVPEETLVALYNLADLFVFPSLYEGFGLPILEAMACGAPVITSSVSAIPEVSGDAAVLVDPKSVAELSTAMEEVAGNPDLRARLGELGLRRAARFNWMAMAAQTLEVYKQCA